MIETDEYGYPVATEAGIRCGNHPLHDTVRHASVEAVGRCFALRFAEQMEEDGLRWAEGAYVRNAEQAGYWEAAAERAWEDSRGVVQFDDAYRAACPELFQCPDCKTPDTQVCPTTCPTRKAEEAQERYANSY